MNLLMNPTLFAANMNFIMIVIDSLSSNSWKHFLLEYKCIYFNYIIIQFEQHQVCCEEGSMGLNPLAKIARAFRGA